MKYTTDDELNSQSEFSPCVISDEEQLVRLAYAPDEVVNGKLIPAAISSKDLKERGYSVFRQKYLVESQVGDLAKKQMIAKPDARKYAYVTLLDVSLVRECEITLPTDKGEPKKERSFVVIDDALEDITSHAAIYSASTKSPSKVKQLKNQLIDIINKNILITSYTPSPPRPPTN